MRALFKRLKFLRDPLILASLLIMLLSIAYIVYSFRPFATGSENVNILEDYVKAVHYLNKSSTALEKRLAGSTSIAIDFDTSDVSEVRNGIEKYMNNLSLVYGSKDAFFVNVAKNYLYTAEGAVNSTAAYYAINSSVDGVREALHLLALCRVNEAIERFSSVEAEVLKALSSIARAISALKRIDKGFVSETHLPVINASLKRLEKSFESLYNAYTLMEIAKQYREYIELMCSGEPVNNTNALSNLLNRVSEVKASGPLSIDIANAKNAIQQLLQDYMRRHGGQQGGEEGKGVGGGAGYAPPESYD